MVRFVVDSTFGVSREYAEAHGVEMVNLTLLFSDGKSFYEEFKGEWDDFYKAFEASDGKVTTSQPNPTAFEAAINRTIERDPDAQIIVMTIADRLSSTISSANIAVLQYPNRDIVAIDSTQAATGGGLILDELIKLRDRGASFQEIVAAADDIKKRTVTEFIPATMEQLKRGGRVGALAAIAGTILKIKPIFHFRDNEVKVPKKGIGTVQACAKAVGMLPDEIERICVCYIHDDTHVPSMVEQIKRKFGMDEVEVLPVSPILAAHVGLATVGFSVILKKN